MSNTAINQTDATLHPDTSAPPVAERNVMVAAKGGAIVFVGKLFTFASRLIITVILARLLGARDYGLYNLAITALALTASLASFGFDSAMVRYVAVFARRRDTAGLWGTLQLGIGITLGLGVALGTALFVFADRIAVAIFDEAALAPVLRVASVVVPLLALNNIAASATQGFKKMQYSTIARDVVQPLLRLALVLLVALMGATAAWALASYGFAIAVSTLLLVFFLHRLFPLRRPLAEGRRDTRELLGYSVPVFLSDLMTTFRENVQTLLLGALNTVASVGLFAVANQINMVGHMFQSAVASASRPIVSELYDQGKLRELGQIYQTTTKWTVTVNLPLFLTMMLFPTAILSIFGKSFVAGAPALMLLAAAIMADVSTGMCGIIIDMTGRTTLKLINSIIRLVLSLGLSVLLIPSYGVVGAAVATLIVVATVNVLRLSQVFVLFRLLPYDRSIVKPILAALAAVAVVYVLRTWLPAGGGLIEAGLNIVVLFAVYIGSVLALGLSPEDRMVWSRLRSRMGRKLARSNGDDHQPQA